MGPFNLLLLFIGALGFINIVHVTAYDIQALLSNISPSSEVFFPNDANWTDTVQRWNAWYEPDFSVAIKPASVADLQTIVGCHAFFAFCVKRVLCFIRTKKRKTK